MWRLVTADGSSDKLCTATKVAKLATDSGTCTILRNTSTSLMTLALLNKCKHLYNSSLACPMGPSTIQCQTALSQSELSFWKLREGIDWANLRHYKKNHRLLPIHQKDIPFVGLGPSWPLFIMRPDFFFLLSAVHLHSSGARSSGQRPFHSHSKHNRISLGNYSGKSQSMLMRVTLHFRNEGYG